jgi:probable phosphoglycerate mutase
MIYLVRHGETEFNRVQRYQGWLDSPLTEAGVAQARAIGRRLAQLPDAWTAEIVASPIGRARRTAELIAAELAGREIGFDDRLREISLGSWDGLDRDEIAACRPGIFDNYDGSWYFDTPDGETYGEFASRIGASLAALAGRPAIVVTHGIVTRVLRGIYTGISRAEAFRLPVPQDRFYRLADGRIEEFTV